MIQNVVFRKRQSILAALVAMALVCADRLPQMLMAAEPTEASRPIQHQITGLFSPDREKDLQQVFEKLPDFKLVRVDFANAEASLEYDVAKVFPGAKPEQIVERLDNLVRGVSNHTFGVKPLRSTKKESMKLIEIPVVGLDCKACSLGAYEAIYRLKGVETATASFKEGRVTALVDPELIDRVELEMALKQRGVQIQMP